MIRLKSITRTVLATFLCMSLIFAMTPKASAAANSLSVPTVSWNLTVTNAMAAAGITSDPANRQGDYNYSAYVNGYKLYSNYYFVPQSQYRFVIDGNEMYSVNHMYRVGMKGVSSGIERFYDIPAANMSFHLDFNRDLKNIPGNAYFYVDGIVNGSVAVSLSGKVSTY